MPERENRETNRKADRSTGHSSLPTPVGSVPEVIKSSFHTEKDTDKRGRRKGRGQSILRKHVSQEASSTKNKEQKQRDRERKRGFSQ